MKEYTITDYIKVYNEYLEVRKSKERAERETKSSSSSLPLKTKATKESMDEIFTDTIMGKFKAQMAKTADEVIGSKVGDLNAKISKAEELVKVMSLTRPIEVKIGKEVIGTVPGLKHEQLSQLITIVSLGHAVLMVGMAGTGKTQAASQVAEALGMPFSSISVGAQTTKSDIMGFISANGDYIPSLFRTAYENGGVFLMDEIDAGNANVLIQINSALANKQCGFPDKMVPMHKDFRFVGTANTYGTGADRMYVGRNVLDSATLDRFTIIDWNVDEKLEGALISQYKNGDMWHAIIKKVREHTIKNKIPALITPRASIKGAQLLGAGFTVNQTAKMVILGGYPKDKIAEVEKLLK
jgi:cobaltochelatase CobS